MRPAEFKINTGADMSVIPAGSYSESNNCVTLKHTSNILFGPCYHKLNGMGKFDAKLESCDSSIDDEIFVKDGLERPLSR